MSYLTIKHLHMTTAILSGVLFVSRFLLLSAGAQVMRQRWTRILPHVIDTLLLATALTMVFWSAQYPFVQHWLTAKVLALFAYIGFGMVALRLGRSWQVRSSAFVFALLCYGYILKVAFTRSVF